jgi:hypothetical protein
MLTDGGWGYEESAGTLCKVDGFGFMKKMGSSSFPTEDYPRYL